MNKAIESVVKMVEGVEDQYKKTDFDSIDSVGYLDVSLSSTEIALTLGKQAEHNAPYVGVYDSLIMRIKPLRTKINAIKAKL